MRKLVGFVTGIGLVLVAALLMAPSGGFPSRPRFQSVGIATTVPSGTGGLNALRIGVDTAAPAVNGQLDAAGTIIARGNVSLLAQSTTNPELELFMQDASADNGRWQIGTATETLRMRALNDSGSQQNSFLEVERTGATIDSVNLLGTSILANGVPIGGGGTSGTFTASFDTACTTTPTLTYDYQQIGNIVVVYPVSSTGFPCTGDSASFVTTGAPVPAAIRPNTNATSASLDGFTNNSNDAWGLVTVTSAGNISFSICDSFMGACASGGWSASLNRVAPTLRPFTYMLGNP